jgi:hypothetical protein
MTADEEIGLFRDQVHATRAKQAICTAAIVAALAIAQFGPDESVDIDEDDKPPLSVGHERDSTCDDSGSRLLPP